MSFFGQVVHVFRKDVRRFWPALAAVAAAVAAQVFLDIDMSGRYATRLGIPSSLFMLGLAALTALVVQEDTPAGDRAFWSTRPLSGGALLASKLLFVALFLVAVPAVVQTLWFESLGVELPRWPVMAETALYVGGPLTLIALGAAVARTLRGFLVLAIGVAMGMSALGGQLMRMDPSVFDPGYRLTSAWLERWAWMGVGTCLLIHQYLTRRTLRTVLVGAVALPLALVGAYRSGLNLAPWAEEPERFAYEHADGLRLDDPELTRLRDARFAGTWSGDEAFMLQAALFSADGADVRLWRLRARIHGGGVDHAFEYETPVGRVSGSPFGRSTSIDGLAPVGGPVSFPALISSPVAIRTREELDALIGAQRLDIELSLDAFRVEVLGRLPLQVGVALRTPRGIYTVREVLRTEASVQVEVAVRSIHRPLGEESAWPFLRGGQVVLANPIRREFLTTGQSGGGSDRYALVPGTSVSDDVRSLAFSAPTTLRDGTSLPDDWFDDVELLVTDFEYAGTAEVSTGWDVGVWPGYGQRVPIDPETGTR